MTGDAEGLPLICPRCRRAGEAGITDAALSLQSVFRRDRDDVLEGTLACPNGACGAIYPIVGGVPIVIRDMAGWWRSQRAGVREALPKGEALGAYFDALDDAEPAADTARALLGTYIDLHYGADLESPAGLSPAANPRAFWAALLAAAEPEVGRSYGRALDLGCSVGRYTFELARMSRLSVGIDLDFTRVYVAEQMRRGGAITYERKLRGHVFQREEASYPAPRNVLFLAADALDPPFRAGEFDLVAGLNLIDSVPRPLLLLGQMDALLSRSGVLIVCAPYEWRPEICSSEEWLETVELPAPLVLRQVLEGTMLEEMGFAYTVSGEWPEVPWVLRNSGRHWSLYVAHVIKAVKMPRPATTR